MAVPSLALLFAHERSGTHMLRSLIAKPGEILAPGEICNATADMNTAAQPLSFFSFRKNLLLQNNDLFLPTEENTRTILDAYFGMVRQRSAGTKQVILDIKYPHVMTFNTFWWNFVDPPHLIRYARHHGFKIIHLTRENVFETAISGIYAEKSGVWRATNEDQLNRISIRVDVRDLRKRITNLTHTMDLFKGWLKGSDHFAIHYEELTGPSPEQALAGLATYLDYPGAFENKPKFVKTTPPYAECIANWDEVRELQTA